MNLNRTDAPRPLIKIWLLRLGALAVVLGALAAYAALAPFNAEQILGNWQLLTSFQVAFRMFSYPVFSGLILGIRYAVILFYLVIGGILFVAGWRLNNQNSGIVLHASVLLFTLPAALLINLAGVGLPHARPWDTVLEITNTLLSVVGLLLLITWYFNYPGGAKQPIWMRWLMVGFTGAVFLGIVLGQSDVFPGDSGFIFQLLTIITAWLAGMVVLILRYRKNLDSEQRWKMRPGFAAMLLQVVAVVSSVFLAQNPSARMAALLIPLFILACLPAGLAWSAFGRGLWGLQLSVRARRWTLVIAGITVLACMSALMIYFQSYVRNLTPVLSFQRLPTADPKRSVIIDTDMGADDWMAILFLLQRPDIAVQAITVSGTGLVHCEPGVRNAASLVRLAGQEKIPVACGRETPLEGDWAFPQDWREKSDRMNGLRLPEGENPAAAQSAINVYQEALGKAAKPLEVLALGPLTNLADLLLTNPELASKIAGVTIMGGALQTPGNVGYFGVEIDNLDAEWNIFIDPLAVQILQESGLPITLVPLDATNKAPVNIETYLMVEANHKTPVADFVRDILSADLGFVTSGGYYFWDPLAAGVLADPSLVTFESKKVYVTTEPGPHWGATRIVQRGLPMRVVQRVDAKRFFNEFLRTLNQPAQAESK